MVKKRSVFDINFEDDAESETEGFPAGNPQLETKSFNVQGHPLQNEAAPARRGPMASAITEAADATSERATAEAAIRAENDALAHEHVRLKKLGLITDLIETSEVVITKLVRDRSFNVDPELAELKDSIQAVGLSNPIRVEQTENGYELIQGFRRLNAFRELAAETNDPRYDKIPAALVPRGEPLADLYRKMVDENLVRKDISFGEMAQLALSYAQDGGIESGEAVSILYASALKQKRSYIRQFAKVLEALGPSLRHPEAIPRALGLDVYKLLEAEEGRGAEIAAKLQALSTKDGASEVRVLRDVLTESRAGAKSPPKAMSKTSLRLARPEGEARVIAQNGKVELRLTRDFSAVSKEELQAAIEAFLDRLS